MGARTPKPAAVKDAEKRERRRADAVLASSAAYLEVHEAKENTKRALDDLRRDVADWRAARIEMHRLALGLESKPANLPVSTEPVAEPAPVIDALAEEPAA